MGEEGWKATNSELLLQTMKIKFNQASWKGRSELSGYTARALGPVAPPCITTAPAALNAETQGQHKSVPFQTTLWECRAKASPGIAFGKTTMWPHRSPWPLPPPPNYSGFKLTQCHLLQQGKNQVWIWMHWGKSCFFNSSSKFWLPIRELQS